MKNWLVRSLIVAGLFAGWIQGVRAAVVTFTNTPAAVSNTYSGFITLQIGGLTNTETVVVQKFLDLNTNGVIDDGDLMVQQFNLTDGQAGMVIGGVTNFNVPGDTDGAANGQITGKVNFQGGDFMQNVVGKYLFKVSGNFTPPLTNSFTVTNFPWAQKFTGNVVSNSVAVPNAVVLLFGSNKGPVAGAIADNSGNYTIAAPVGTYSVVACKSNFVANMSAAPVFTLAANQTITNNPALINATTSISGSVVDASNSSIGLPGMLIPAQANGLLAIAFTDTNGNFNVPVTAGNWKIEGNDTALIVHGYLGLQNKTTVNAGATGVTIAVPKATALIYGSVKDNLGNPFVGLAVYVSDQNNLYQTDGYTDANGKYVLGVLGLGSSDQWWMDANDNNQITNYLFSQSQLPNNGSIASGAAVQQKFTAILATNYITGNVKASGTNIVGVGVNANATINSVNFSQYVDTDTNGNYSLTVAGGTWSVSVNCNGGSDSLDNILGSGTYQCPDNQNVNINNNNATNNFTVPPCGGVQILTTNLPDGQVGVFYGLTLQGSTCSGQLNWTLNDPLDFPTSLGFSQNGAIQGTPDTSGTYYFSVQLNDGNVHYTNQNLSLYIAPAPSPLAVTTTSLTNGTVNTFYSQTLQASGGQPPYNWWVLGGTITLPPGTNGDMNFSSDGTNGTISGTPGTAGNFSFWVGVSDTASPPNVVSNMFSITITGGSSPLQITTTSLPNGTNGTFYTQTIQGSGGQLPYSWAIANYSADPPPNLTLATDGVLSGTLATNGGPFYFDVEVTDGAANTAYQTLSVYIVNPPLPPLLITNVSLPNGNVGAAYSAQLGATGGQPPYNWQLATGSANPPAGLTLYSSGLISGTPTTNKVSTFKVQATDANSTTTNKVFSITINAKPVLGLPTWFTNRFQMRLTGASNQNYTVQMSTNLSSATWTSLLVTNSPATNSFLLTDPSATNQQRFYRILIGP